MLANLSQVCNDITKVSLWLFSTHAVIDICGHIVAVNQKLDSFPLSISIQSLVLDVFRYL